MKYTECRSKCRPAQGPGVKKIIGVIMLGYKAEKFNIKIRAFPKEITPGPGRPDREEGMYKCPVFKTSVR